MANTYHALETRDAEWTCWDVVIPAWEIAQLFRAGYIQIDPEHQRGKNTVTGKRIKNQGKIDRWAEQLIDGDCVLGQLTLNYRQDDPRSKVKYDETRHELRAEGVAHAPDSAHRIEAVVQADDSIQRGSGFDPTRPISVRIYNIEAADEDRLFYALNQEGEKADPTRSKFLHPAAFGQKLAKDLVERSPYLSPDNVNTMQDRLSKRDHRLVAFNTISKGIETVWKDAQIDTDGYDTVLKWLMAYWEKLVDVRPELRKVDVNTRNMYRETTTAASAIAIHGYLALAYRMWSEDASFGLLDALADDAWFAKDNPEWVRRGVVVPEMDSKGRTKLSLRNALQTRVQYTKALLVKVGLERSDEPESYEVTDAHTKEEAVKELAKLIGVPNPGLAPGSTEPKSIFVDVNERLSLGLDDSVSKPRLAAQVVEKAGLEWGPDCDSQTSPSGGGSAVTLTGLNRVLTAVSLLVQRQAA